jgi:hypothetical protein
VARRDEGHVVSRISDRPRGRPLPASQTQAANEGSYRDHEACLDKLARYLADLELSDLEPPLSTELLEEFLDFQWGSRMELTYNKNLLSSTISSCSRFAAESSTVTRH